MVLINLNKKIDDLDRKWKNYVREGHSRHLTGDLDRKRLNGQ